MALSRFLELADLKYEMFEEAALCAASSNVSYPD
jgi:hypothetical protein